MKCINIDETSKNIKNITNKPSIFIKTLTKSYFQSPIDFK